MREISLILRMLYAGVSIPVTMVRARDTSGWTTSSVLGRSSSYRTVTMVTLARTTVPTTRTSDFAACVRERGREGGWRKRSEGSFSCMGGWIG